MRILQISIQNFRGIESAQFPLPAHAVLVGDNYTGKSTDLEAIDLVMGQTGCRSAHLSRSTTSTKATMLPRQLWVSTWAGQPHRFASS